jgi:hypothetical protein
MNQESSISLIKDEPLLEVKEGLQFDVSLVVSDPSAFIRFVLKEHLQTQHEDLIDNPRKPPESIAVNALYDEIVPWLGTPSMIGLSILAIELNSQAYTTKALNKSPQVTTKDIVEHLHSSCRGVDRTDADSMRTFIDEIQSQAKEILSSLKNVKNKVIK